MMASTASDALPLAEMERVVPCAQDSEKIGGYPMLEG